MCLKVIFSCCDRFIHLMYEDMWKSIRRYNDEEEGWNTTNRGEEGNDMNNVHWVFGPEVADETIQRPIEMEIFRKKDPVYSRVKPRIERGDYLD